MDRKDYIDAYLDYLMVISIEDLFSKINFITSYGNRFEDPLRKDNFIKEMQPIYNKGLDKGIKHINNMDEICSIYKEKVTKLTSISNLHKAVKEENNL